MSAFQKKIRLTDWGACTCVCQNACVFMPVSDFCEKEVRKDCSSQEHKPQGPEMRSDSLHTDALSRLNAGSQV